ncbi:MAG: prepilin-type N-terminal cleavage/methylation domain-containing protein [Clostridiaceae bacterium]|nr:prepilin-type N-terminal cleavage/methylation domain-containing protein [Clostridiaceae bacterium]
MRLQRLSARKGFTLVEVIVVLVILAILAAILVPSLVGYIDKANETKCLVTRRSLLRSFVAYENLARGAVRAAGNAEPFSTDERFQAFLADPEDYGNEGACPCGGEYHYEESTDGTMVVYCTYPSHGGKMYALYFSSTDSDELKTSVRELYYAVTASVTADDVESGKTWDYGAKLEDALKVYTGQASQIARLNLWQKVLSAAGYTFDEVNAEKEQFGSGNWEWNIFYVADSTGNYDYSTPAFSYIKNKNIQNAYFASYTDQNGNTYHDLTISGIDSGSLFSKDSNGNRILNKENIDDYIEKHNISPSS